MHYSPPSPFAPSPLQPKVLVLFQLFPSISAQVWLYHFSLTSYGPKLFGFLLHFCPELLVNIKVSNLLLVGLYFPRVPHQFSPVAALKETLLLFVHLVLYRSLQMFPIFPYYLKTPQSDLCCCSCWHSSSCSSFCSFSSMLVSP